MDDAVPEAAIMAELPRLRRYAIVLLGNPADADDAVQDTVERALARRASLREPARLRGWLFAILHNRCISDLRRRKRRGRTLALDDMADDLALSVPAAERTAVRDLVRAFAALSEEHRQVLLLVGLEGLRYQEAADALGLPIGTVMSRLARAREALRLRMEGGTQQVMRRVT